MRCKGWTGRLGLWKSRFICYLKARLSTLRDTLEWQTRMIPLWIPRVWYTRNMMSESWRLKYSYLRGILLDIKTGRLNCWDRLRSTSSGNVLIYNRLECYRRGWETLVMRMIFHNLPRWAVQRRLHSTSLTFIVVINRSLVHIGCKLELKLLNGRLIWRRRRIRIRSCLELKGNSWEGLFKGYRIVSRLWVLRLMRLLTPPGKCRGRIWKMCLVRTSLTWLRRWLIKLGIWYIRIRHWLKPWDRWNSIGRMWACWFKNMLILSCWLSLFIEYWHISLKLKSKVLRRWP